MKKIVFFAAGFALCASLALGAARPSIDGRASVADDGSLPSGLFAKSVGYLPGDSISVTNHTNGRSVDVLVVGAMEPSSGVAVLLSPEAATRIGVKKNSSAQVKVTRREGPLDAASADPLYASDDAARRKALADLLLAVSGEDKKDAPPSSPSLEFVPMEDLNLPPAPKEQPPALTVPEPVVKVEPLPEPEPPAKEEPLDEELLLGAKKRVPEERLVLVDSYDEPLDEELVLMAAAAGRSNPSSEERLALARPAPAGSRPPVSESVVYIDDLMPPVPSESRPERVVLSGPAPVSSPKPKAPETPVVIDDYEKDAYDSIVLVPAFTNPPEGDDRAKKPAPEAEETPVGKLDVPEEFVMPPVSEEPASVPKKPEAPARKPAASEEPASLPKPAPDSGYKKYVVDGLDKLKPGKYYIQIATLGSESNLNGIVSQYAGNYPMVLVKDGTGSRYMVMVGELNVDEYGTVLDRFKKSYGFKDAFTRKIR